MYEYLTITRVDDAQLNKYAANGWRVVNSELHTTTHSSHSLAGNSYKTTSVTALMERVKP